MDGIDLGVIGGAITAGAGSLAGAIKWAVGRILADAVETREVIKENTKAMTINNERTSQQIASNEALRVELRAVFNEIGKIGRHVEETTNPHAVPYEVPRKPRSPVRGIPAGEYGPRRPTNREDDDR